MTADSVLVDVADVEAWNREPLYLFIGVSTTGSSIHRAFPLWSHLFAPGSVIRGVDLPEDAEPERFRRLVLAMRSNPLVRGAVITSHKLRMYRAIADLIDDADPLAAITHEISSLDTRDGVRVLARDPQSLDVLLDAMTPWIGPSGSVVCLGSGGAAIALMLAMGLDVRATIGSGRTVLRDRRSSRGSLTILGIEQAALDEVRLVQRRAGLSGAGITLALAPTPAHAAAHTRSAAAGSVVVNATGLGKTGPGSPLHDRTAFPPGVLAWDFNYRGPLTFLEQAREAGAATVDGWDYFLAGWTAALAAITGNEPTPELFGRVKEASTGLRPR